MQDVSAHGPGSSAARTPPQGVLTAPTLGHTDLNPHLRCCFHCPQRHTGVQEAKGSFLWGLLLPFSPSTQPPTCAKRLFLKAVSLLGERWGRDRDSSGHSAGGLDRFTRCRQGACGGTEPSAGGAGPAHLQKCQEGGLGGAGLPQHGHRGTQVVDVAAVGVQHHGLGELGSRGRLRTCPRPSPAQSKGFEPCPRTAPRVRLRGRTSRRPAREARRPDRRHQPGCSPAFARERVRLARRGAERPRAPGWQHCPDARHGRHSEGTLSSTSYSQHDVLSLEQMFPQQMF